MFKKKYEYGLLQNIEEEGWHFNKEKLNKKNFIEVLNYLGEKGWEMIEVDNQIGFLFKKVK